MPAAIPLRELLIAPAGRETVRAFLVFGLLLVALVGIGAELALRDFSQKMLLERIELGQHEAAEIAEEVSLLGSRGGDGVSYAELRRHHDFLHELIRTRIAGRWFIRHVEVRDRFGGRLVFVAGEAAIRDIVAPSETAPRIIQVPLHAGEPARAGEVRLGISEEALHQELDALGRSLRVKLAVGGLLALGLLVTAFFYVLHLIRKNRGLEQARQSAARASYVGLLASGLAHEIRNPLNAMNLNLQMLEEELAEDPGRRDGDTRELLDSTKSEIQRLESLVNNFLAYARPAAPRFETRDLNAIVRDVLRFLEADFRQSQVRLESDLEPLLPVVELDETQFKQALMNLLVNARQVLRDGGRVVVRTRAGASGDVVLEVEDDGPGIPLEARERIFEVFYSSRGGGTGLGLPIARQVVERHGGSIGVETEEGRGTTFRIRLPRRHERDAGPAPAVAGRAS